MTSQLRKPKLLITGVSGFLGWNLARIARRNWEVHGLQNSHSVKLDGLTTHQCNLTDTSALRETVESLQVDAIIHLAAVSSPNTCQDNPELAKAVNVDASQQLARLANQSGARLLFTSSSQVYDGKNPPYDETSLAQAINAYGQQKLAAESAIRESCPQAVICRVPLMYGASPPEASSSLQPVLAALRSRQTMKLFTDEIRSSLGAESASLGLLHALAYPGETFLIAGDEPLSRYEFGCRVADFFGYDKTPLVPSLQSDLPMAASRPRDLRMNTFKIRQTGFNPLSLEEELAVARQLGA